MKAFKVYQVETCEANMLNDDAASCLASALKNCDGLLRLDLQQNVLQAGPHEKGKLGYL